VDLTPFAAAVGATGPVTCVGARRLWDVGGRPAAGAREVTPPAGIEWIAPEEMTVSCGAGTPVAELDSALAEHGQQVALPAWGTVGGVLAVGRSDHRRLGYGPVRDTLLQAGVVTSGGEVAKVGGPTVKNVSGFDLARLLVGSLGTLAFLGDVILRTRPRPQAAAWYRAADGTDPFELFRALYRPTSLLWDGTTTWVLLEGHPTDLEAAVTIHGLASVEGPPSLPPHRLSMPPSALRGLDGRFVAEIGVGLVHLDEPAAAAPPSDEVVALHRRIKGAFDPTGRLNPGRDPLAR
jgi:glycolate oxidase FAD binding subunit